METHIAVAIAAGVVVCIAAMFFAAYVKKSARAKAWYLVCIIVLPIAALIIGGVASTISAGGLAFASQKTFLEGYAAALVVFGAFLQLLLEISKRNNEPLIGKHRTAKVVRELAPAVAGKKMNNKKKNKIRQTFEIVIGEDDTRDAVRASGWSLIFVGAIAAAVAVFFP